MITWVKELDDLMGFQCFYHPEDPHIVYMETATYWRVIALFVAALLMFVLGIWGEDISRMTFIIVMEGCHPETRSKNLNLKFILVVISNISSLKCQLCSFIQIENNVLATDLNLVRVFVIAKRMESIFGKLKN